MHFTFRQEPGVFTITAGLVDAHGDVRTGNRVQSDKTPLTLTETRVSFGLDIQNLDYDRLALACCLLFLPFIGNKVSFSFPVSDVIPEFLHANKRGAPGPEPVEVTTTVTGPRPENASPITLATCGLALGGGFDAVAVKTLLPEVFSYHLVSAIIVNNVFHLPIYRFYADRDAIRLNDAPVCDQYIWTNAENIASPRGVTTWATYAIPMLLAGADLGLNCILSGTVFEGSFNENGRRYVEFRPGNRHDTIGRAFAALGLRIAPAATMLPEYLNIKEVALHGLGDQVSFCIMGPNGGPCGRCLKCYRKRLLYEALKRETAISIPQFEAMDIARFDNPYIAKLCQVRPVYLASSFKWLQGRVPESLYLPSMADAVAQVPPVRFDLGRYFPPGLDILPDTIASAMTERLSRRYQPMSAEEIAAVRAWNCFAAA
ncbi:DUF6395 domain-containing protein [Devosia sp. 1566]|uniref:DUF6395 domain-containing protein n=1 Tax=Devosia sp. 1566 TaxID=2499144 RepID=UPI000FDAF770|nr:DUF6395 domain-containing protein [Devosia sp. 1566]